MIVNDPMVTGFELSSVQERLYAISQGASAFQCQSALWIAGPLDIARMRDSIEKVTGRHEILRTSFRRQVGRRLPLQIVHPDSKSCFKVVDLRGEGADGRESRIEQCLCALRERAVNLENDALVRFDLLTLDENDHL